MICMLRALSNSIPGRSTRIGRPLYSLYPLNSDRRCSIAPIVPNRASTSSTWNGLTDVTFFATSSFPIASPYLFLLLAFLLRYQVDISLHKFYRAFRHRFLSRFFILCHKFSISLWDFYDIRFRYRALSLSHTEFWNHIPRIIVRRYITYSALDQIV